MVGGDSESKRDKTLIYFYKYKIYGGLTDYLTTVKCRSEAFRNFHTDTRHFPAPILIHSSEFHKLKNLVGFFSANNRPRDL